MTLHSARLRGGSVVYPAEIRVPPPPIQPNDNAKRWIRIAIILAFLLGFLMGCGEETTTARACNKMMQLAQTGADSFALALAMPTTSTLATTCMKQWRRSLEVRDSIQAVFDTMPAIEEVKP